MTITTVAINCDVSLANNTEFTASQLEFTLSDADYDTISNDSVPAATVVLALDASGVATANLWPVDRGTRNTFYRVVLIGTRTINGRATSERFALGNIAPPSTGAPFALADLLGQSSGGIVVGSTIYETLADAVAAAVAAGAAGADPVAATAAAERAEDARDAAQLAQANAELAETGAEAARDAALLSRGVFASTALGLSNGVAAVTVTGAGSGGANGVFALAFSGGAGTGAAGTFTVASGAVVSVTITNPGTGYTSAPTVSFAASAGLTGVTATVAIAPRNPVGTYFSIPATGNASLILYRVDAGPVAAEVVRYPSAAALTVAAAKAEGWVAVLSDGAGGHILPVCQIDLTNNRCWFNGAIVPISEVLTDNGDGSYTFAQIPPGLATNDGSGVAVAVDYQFPENYTAANAPANTVFSWNRTPGNSPRLELDVWQTSNSTQVGPGGVHQLRAFMGYLNNFYPGTALFADDTGTRRTEGVQRQIYSVPPSGAVRGVRNYGYQSVGASVLGTYNAPTIIQIGRNAFSGGGLVANTTIHQVIIYRTHLTEAQIDELARFNERRAPPLFFTGDSLQNLGQLESGLKQLTTDFGYLPTWTDNKGGRGLNHHLGRVTAILAAHPKLREAIPVLWEGGIDYSGPAYPSEVTEGPFSERQLVGFIRDIFDQFKPTARVLMLPHTNAFSHAGPEVLAVLNATIANFRSAFPDAACDWQGKLQAQAATDADYLALRAAQRTPPALLLNGVAADVHISWPDGYKYAAHALRDRLGAMGWPGALR